MAVAEKRRRHYETIIILSPTLKDEETKALIEKNSKILQDQGAKVLRQDDWGKRRMAYVIKKHAMGTYYYLRYIASSEARNEFERNLKLNVSALRFRSFQLSSPLTEIEERHLIERAPKEPALVPALGRMEEEETEMAMNFHSY